MFSYTLYSRWFDLSLQDHSQPSTGCQKRDSRLWTTLRFMESRMQSWRDITNSINLKMKNEGKFMSFL